MGESLWADIDDWLVSYLEGKMGDALIYPTLTTKMVVATLARNYAGWDNAGVWKFPAIIVDGSHMDRPEEGRGFGNGMPHYRKVLPYVWYAVVQGDSFSSVRDAKIMEKRMEIAGRELVANGWGSNSLYPIGPDLSGEIMTQIILGYSDVAKFPRASNSEPDSWYGVAALTLNFITTL